MTQLSPATQAVLDAYRHSPADDRLAIAAALRAAVVQCKQTREVRSASKGRVLVETVIPADSLLAIVIELEVADG